MVKRKVKNIDEEIKKIAVETLEKKSDKIVKAITDRKVKPIPIRDKFTRRALRVMKRLHNTIRRKFNTMSFERKMLVVTDIIAMEAEFEPLMQMSNMRPALVPDTLHIRKSTAILLSKIFSPDSIMPPVVNADKRIHDVNVKLKETRKQSEINSAVLKESIKEKMNAKK